MRQVADLLGLQNAAAGRQVGVDDVDGAGMDQRAKVLLQEDVLYSLNERHY